MPALVFSLQRAIILNASLQRGRNVQEGPAKRCHSEAHRRRWTGVAITTRRSSAWQQRREEYGLL